MFYGLLSGEPESESLPLDESERLPSYEYKPSGRTERLDIPNPKHSLFSKVLHSIDCISLAISFVYVVPPNTTRLISVPTQKLVARNVIRLPLVL